jgi:cytochrome b6-f complex iron-sulfur subunit/menaquinol-cytochrome c reductase iron-sulfur subunit
MARSERDETRGDKNEPAAPEGNAAPERRAALRTLVTLGGLAYAAALAVPAARFLAASAEEHDPGGARWIPIGKLHDLAEGTPLRLSLRGDERDAFTLSRDHELGSVWILRRGEAVSALSAACPHLGCSVDLAADHRSFGCPCHASRFALDGAAEAGPSPRALDTLATRVVDGVVEVDFRRYRQGLAERREVAS